MLSMDPPPVFSILGDDRIPNVLSEHRHHVEQQQEHLEQQLVVGVYARLHKL